MRERFAGAAVGACLVGCVAVAADAVGAVWRCFPVVGFEDFVRRLARQRLSEGTFFAAALLAAGLGVCALVQIARERRRRGMAAAVVGIIAPWLARAILDGLL